VKTAKKKRRRTIFQWKDDFVVEDEEEEEESENENENESENESEEEDEELIKEDYISEDDD
jgi:hypothetical protein